jgi:hypothetical protein|tara:strand:+ start:2669 stop:2848 length:180 start_codon:yes stop_codon:yes gene_type:complete
VTFVTAPFRRAYSHVQTSVDMLMSAQAQPVDEDAGPPTQQLSTFWKGERIAAAIIKHWS